MARHRNPNQLSDSPTNDHASEAGMSSDLARGQCYDFSPFLTPIYDWTNHQTLLIEDSPMIPISFPEHTCHVTLLSTLTPLLTSLADVAFPYHGLLTHGAYSLISD